MHNGFKKKIVISYIILWIFIRTDLMYYNIYLLVVIAFKSMMIYNTEWTCCIHLSYNELYLS